MRGDLLEAKASCATWEDVGKETFERLVQFAYTGDYSIPKPTTVARNTPAPRAPPSVSNGIRADGQAEGRNKTVVIDEPDEGAYVVEESDPIVAENASSWGPLGTSKKGKNKKGKGAIPRIFDWSLSPDAPGRVVEPPSPPIPSRRERYRVPPSPKLLAADFQSLSISLLAPRNIHLSTCEPDNNFEAGKSYSNVFLAHASLFVLGDYWLIDTLKALALHKLHKTLCIFDLDDRNVEDVIALARYAYSEEGKGLEEGIGELRGLVCQYMAANAVELSLISGFMELLEEGGQFVKDLFKFVLQGTH